MKPTDVRASDRATVASRLRGGLEVASSIALIGVSAVIAWSLARPKVLDVARPPVPSASVVPLPDEPLTLAGAATKGSPAAPVAIVEFSEFQCPFCRKYAVETLPQLEREYVDAGKVMLVFRHLPLDKHAQAEDAAVLAGCANAQGKFWPVHHAFFAGPAVVSVNEFRSRAIGAGVDAGRLDHCAKERDARRQVTHDRAIAQALGIRGTPVFFLGPMTPEGVVAKRVLVGAQPFADMKRAIDTLLGGN